MSRTLSRTLLLTALLVAGAACADSELASRNVDWRRLPVQEPTERAPFRHEDHEIRPRARFEVDGVVARSERYWLDRFAELSPVDVVMTWGTLPEIEDRVDYSQAGRFYLWIADGTVDRRRVETQSANMHLIPATRNLARALSDVDRGDEVRIAGLLVDAEGPDGWRVKTSLTREDTGAGGCEVIWVEELQVGTRVYR
jgi:hypothetical protein